MRKSKLFTIFIILIFQGIIFSQNNRFANKMYGSGKPVFDYTLEKYFVEEDGFFNLGCYLKIDNDRLHFTKHDSLYHAEYEVSIAVFEEDNDDIPITQKKERKRVTVNTFLDTESRQESHFNKYDFKLKEGQYEIVIKLRDVASNKTYTISEQISFLKTGKMGVTNLIMVNMEEGHKKFDLPSIQPLVNNTVTSKTPFIGAFFEIYTENKESGYEIEYTISTADEHQIFQTSYSRKTDKKVNKELIHISLKNITVGTYHIKLQIKANGKTFFREQRFFVKYKDMSVQVEDIPQSVEQMLYIMEYDSLKKVFEMKSEEQKEWFKNFWNTLEENSGNSKNSLMEEYFRRINYANTHFKAFKKSGWKTDMGKVLCLMGEPDEVHNYSFPANNKHPYEVWVYYEKSVQYFFDDIGGEFKLRRQFKP